MGQFKDHVDDLKADLAPVPFGGTVFPTSEGFPIALSQNISGAFAPYPTLDVLADIPYKNLQFDMEAVVSEYMMVDTSTHPRTRYRLKQLPPADTKVSEVPSFDVMDYWEAVTTDGGDPGDPGNNGWSPVLAAEADGPTRTLLKVIGWIGGQGTAPGIPDPNYIGTTGFVAKSSATNFKGDQGLPGSTLAVRPDAYFKYGERKVGDPSTVWPPPGTSPTAMLFLNGELTVINNWTQSRNFICHVQVPVSNDNGSDSWVAELHAPTSSAPLVFVGAVDENASRQDFISSANNRSVHKIDLWHSVQLPPNGSIVYKVKLGQPSGGQSLIADPYFEAWGL